MKKVHLIVTGRVQGVWYRGSARDRARTLGVNGFARNLRDGTVELVVEGEDVLVDQMIAWAWEGPKLAIVSDIKVEELPYEPEYHDFGVLF
jgi:acylphosphatase